MAQLLQVNSIHNQPDPTSTRRQKTGQWIGLLFAYSTRAQLIRHGLVFAGLSFLLASCLQDHRIVAAGKNYRLSTYARVGGGYLATTFKYDANNRLISYVYNDYGNPITTTLDYDVQNRVVSVETPRVGVYERYEYDNQNNVSVIKQYSAPPNPLTDTPVAISTLSYSSTKFPDQITTVSFSTTNVVSNTYVEGNIVQQQTSTYQPGAVPTTSSATFHYDNRPNPFYGLGVPFYTYDTFSRNNVIEIAGTSFSYSHQYDSNGLLIRRDWVGNADHYYETFGYESY